MTARSAFRLGQGIGGLIAIAAAIAAFAWSDFLRLTADEQNRDAVAWVYDGDAAPGQTLHGRVWLEHGEVENTEVERWTHRDQPDMRVDRLGDNWVPERQRDSSQSFSFAVPADAAPGDTLDLDLEIHRTRGDSIVLTHQLRLISRGASRLRRIGKGALALGLLAGLASIVFLVKRRALRRGGEESPLWLIPAVVVGAVSFVPLVEQATGVHGWWFYGLALAAWAFAAFALAERLNRRIGLTRFAAAQVLVDVPASDAFRGAAVSAPIRPIDDLANAWAAIGLTPRRSGRDLIMTGPGRRIAIVEVPRSESVGGAPLVFRASDEGFADLLVASASDVLGELRFE